ncbi:MAG TPA: Asp-tRNA(Asn)/Glu-tRNA(Gln) amidotransferase GatCAB subunit B, partial [Chthonomonadaceae bacterium]|nr:Asp-tRNA(Asn)/Glu-tRNA(Gln) amidotransferase GatCAB subunit B [Chthonomonadaceae bacterium]
LDAAWIERLRATLPELPDARRARFLQEYSLPAYDAGLLTETRALAGYFEETATRAGDPKAAANWIMGDLTRLLNAHNRDIAACPISPENLAGMIRLIAEGTISGRIAKTLIEEMFATGRPPAQIVEEKGWKTLTDTGAIAALVEKVVADHPQIVADIREKGLVQKKGFLVGQVMQASQGKADPKEVNRLIEEKLRVPGVANTRQ